MPDRLNRIVTRGGDGGETSLANGARVPKDDPRITLIGEIDELNSWLGVVIARAAPGFLRETLEASQHDLFNLGGALSFPGAPALSDAALARLDAAAAALNKDLPPLKEFILPGGSEEIAFCHVARTVCRRVERSICAFTRAAPETSTALKYLNRLSDVLFIAARVEARRLGVAEVYWRKDKDVSS